MDKLESLEKKFVCFFREYGKYIMGGLLGGILGYFMLMASELVNDLDGIWHLSNFVAGDWEISLGRGLQRYADRARFGIVSSPWNTILTLLLIGTANAAIVKKFSLDKSLYAWLIVILLTVNPVICNSLSYSYMSVNFGLAYFFSVLSFQVITITDNYKAALVRGCLGGALLGISMAFYQAYTCVTSVLLVIFALKCLVEGTWGRAMLRYATSCVCALASGGLAYLCITKALLYRAGIGLSSYKGADNIGLWRIVSRLPFSLSRCYQEFSAFFAEKKALSNLEFIDLVLAGLFLSCLAAAALQFARLFRRRRAAAALFLAAILLLPAAGCFVLLIAVGNSMTDLTALGMIMCPVLLGVIVPRDGKAGFFVKRAYLLFLLCFAWFQISAVNLDQAALKEGKNATVALAENIISRIYDSGYPGQWDQVAFVGRPGNNDSFAKNAAYQAANEYAKFGCWSTDARNNRASWAGITSNILGVNINQCSEEDYKELTALEQVAQMPEFPAEGSICVIDGIIVVKVSELY